MMITLHTCKLHLLISWYTWKLHWLHMMITLHKCKLHLLISWYTCKLHWLHMMITLHTCKLHYWFYDIHESYTGYILWLPCIHVSYQYWFHDVYESYTGYIWLHCKHVSYIIIIDFMIYIICYNGYIWWLYGSIHKLLDL